MEHLGNLARSAPTWLIVATLVLLAVLLIGALPLAGYLIERKRRKDNYAAALAGVGNVSFFAGQPNVSRYDRRPDRYALGFDGAWAPDQTWAGQRTLALPPGGLVVVWENGDTAETVLAFEGEEPTEDEVELDVREAERIEAEPVSEPEPEEQPTQADRLPEWAESGTQAMNVLEYMDAELVEVESEAERAFTADPLNSWVLPPVEEYHYLPEADAVFRDLVARNWLTGEGADVSAEWIGWYPDSFLMEGASA